MLLDSYHGYKHSPSTYLLAYVERDIKIHSTIYYTRIKRTAILCYCYHNVYSVTNDPSWIIFFTLQKTGELFLIALYIQFQF